MVKRVILRHCQECHGQCDQIGRFIALWQPFKACGNNYFAQIAHIFGNFCKGVKMFQFSSEIILSILYRHLATFYWSHWSQVTIDGVIFIKVLLSFFSMSSFERKNFTAKLKSQKEVTDIIYDWSGTLGTSTLVGANMPLVPTWSVL